MAEAGHLAEQGAILCFPTYYMFVGSQSVVDSLKLYSPDYCAMFLTPPRGLVCPTTAWHDRRNNMHLALQIFNLAEVIMVRRMRSSYKVGGLVGGFGKTDY